MTREYVCGMATLVDCVGGLIGIGLLALVLAVGAAFGLWLWLDERRK